MQQNQSFECGFLFRSFRFISFRFVSFRFVSFLFHRFRSGFYSLPTIYALNYFPAPLLRGSEGAGPDIQLQDNN